jgi:uncharacterized membrane protein YgdD (TMEM256/DUF423 family)
MSVTWNDAGAQGARFLFAAASLLMAAGIGMAAVSAHAGAGHEIGVAATVMLANAPMLAAGALGVAVRQMRPMVGVLGLLFAFAGTLLFSADMLHRGFGHGALFENAAPIGGSIDIFAWIIVALAAISMPRRTTVA